MFQLLFTVVGLTSAALLSPGPNFVLISGRALSSGPRSAVATAVGVSVGTLTHASFGILGFGTLLQSSQGLFTAIKVVGALYLMWIGFKAIRSSVRIRRVMNKAKTSPPSDTVSSLATDRDPMAEPNGGLTLRRSVLDGYLTQMSNPKTTLFFLALFTTVVPPGARPLEGAAVVAAVVLTALLGYSAVALLFSRPALQRRYQQVGYMFDAAFGGLMVALGIRVGLSNR